MIHSAIIINSRQGGEATCTETVQYHSVGPDSSKPGPRSSHVYTDDPFRSNVYSYAMASWEGMATEACVYENPATNVSMHRILHIK